MGPQVAGLANPAGTDEGEVFLVSSRFQGVVQCLVHGPYKKLSRLVMPTMQAGKHPPLGEIAYRTGGNLEFDPQSQQFVNDDEANAMLTKEYRKPFELPQV